MTGEEALIEVLERLASQHGSAVYINNQELSEWPSDVVAAMKSQKLLTKARPAQSAICSGCERECVMPVYIMSRNTGDIQAFIVCDKRSDINRVPVQGESIEQWQASGDSISDLLAKLLGLNRSDSKNGVLARWEIGVFKGSKHSGHLVMNVEDQFDLTLAGYVIPLTEVLSFDGQSLKIDNRKLIKLVDQPVQGGGNAESAAQRRERLKKRVEELKAKGVKAFLKTVAGEEGISISRLKQLLQDEHEPIKKNKSLW